MTIQPTNFTQINTSGNGSCGPNALSIIFCSYLLSGQFEPVKSEIDLTELAICWNVYFANNNPQHVDYINTSNPEICYEGLKARITSKLESDRVRYGGNSFKHCEQLLAPMLRFAFIFKNRLGNPANPFIEYYGPCSSEYQQDLAREIVSTVKQEMSERISVENGDGTTDNSPNYRSYFNQEAMHYASGLLRLATYNNSTLRGSSEFEGFPDDQVPSTTVADLNGIPQTYLQSIISNPHNIHYTACLPPCVHDHPSLRPYHIHSSSVSYLSDHDAYTPPLLPQDSDFTPPAQPNNRTNNHLFVPFSIALVSMYFAPVLVLSIVACASYDYIRKNDLSFGGQSFYSRLENAVSSQSFSSSFGTANTECDEFCCRNSQNDSERSSSFSY